MTTQSDTPLPVVARLYTVQRGSRAIRRASVLNGEGEPLVRLEDAERALTAEREKNAKLREEMLEEAAKPCVEESNKRRKWHNEAIDNGDVTTAAIHAAAGMTADELSVIIRAMKEKQ